MMNQSSKKPNIVLIVLDAVRFDHVGCYGHTAPTTPYIDKIAQEGVQYLHAYAPAIWTLPAMTSIFTGLYPAEHSINYWKSSLPAGSTNLIDWLHQYNYRTAAFVGTPWSSIGRVLNLDAYEVVDSLFDTWNPKWWQAKLQGLYMRVRRQDDKGAKKINRLALDWIDSEAKRGEPFFMYLHYMEAHGAYWPPKSSRDQFVTYQETPAKKSLWDLSRAELAYLAEDMHLSDEELAAICSLYDAGIHYIDSKVAEVVEHLRQKGMLDNTLLIITADHGENLGEHKMIGHQYSIHDTLLHVPLIIRYPDAFSPGEKVDKMVQTHDVMATVAQLLGDSRKWQPLATRWQSLVPDTLPPANDKDRVYAQYLHAEMARFERRYPHFDYARYNHTYWSMRTPTHKFFYDDREAAYLYDYVQDPGETQNLAASQRILAQSLRQELNNWQERLGQQDAAQWEDVNQKTLDRLKDLGYL